MPNKPSEFLPSHIFLANLRNELRSTSLSDDQIDNLSRLADPEGGDVIRLVQQRATPFANPQIMSLSNPYPAGLVGSRLWMEDGKQRWCRFTIKADKTCLGCGQVVRAGQPHGC